MEKVPYKSGLEIRGIAASPGISIGKAYVMKKNIITATGNLLENESDVKKEIEKFDKSVETSVAEVEAIINNATSKLKQEEIEILETHIEFLRDPQIRSDVFDRIKHDRKNVVDAVIQVIQDTVQVFKSMDDEYMKERAADVADIGNRILKNLAPIDERGHQNFKSDTIIIAEDISPSDTIAMDMSTVIGFATQAGGRTSHTAILARSKNIPAVLGCGDALSEIKTDDVVIVDGTNGVIILNPEAEVIEKYKIRKDAYAEETIRLSSLKDISAQTTDGIEADLKANIASSEDMEASLEFGAAGAGLFRTEMLYMDRDSFPSEDEQFEFYKKVALKSQGKPVVVRTIDIGGDKPLTYFDFPKEDNPFLGYRAIRICLDRKDIFITQLKAILRAGFFGNFRIMFPMITNVQELRLAKGILQEAKKELDDQGIAFDKNVPVGIMIEVPSAAVTADILAKEVDFFSIGTNDLCQYTLAVDRGNEKIKTMYDPYNPAVLRLIRYVIEQANVHKIGVSMCGELAADPLATALLLGMGLREFSMSASSIPVIKSKILKSRYLKAKELCDKVMAMDNSKSIMDYLKNN